jgi:hypothetical protein
MRTTLKVKAKKKTTNSPFFPHFIYSSRLRVYYHIFDLLRYFSHYTNQIQRIERQNNNLLLATKLLHKNAQN